MVSCKSLPQVDECCPFSEEEEGEGDRTFFEMTASTCFSCVAVASQSSTPLSRARESLLFVCVLQHEDRVVDLQGGS